MADFFAVKRGGVGDFLEGDGHMVLKWITSGWEVEMRRLAGI